MQVREVRIVAIIDELVKLFDAPSIELSQVAYVSYQTLDVGVRVSPQKDVMVVRPRIVDIIEVCMCSEFLLLSIATDRPKSVKLCS